MLRTPGKRCIGPLVLAVLVSALGCAVSSASAHVSPNSRPRQIVRARIVGVAKVGHLLTAVVVRASQPMQYRYQWDRCNEKGANCRRIRGGAHRRYRVSTGDLGHTVAVTVTARGAAGPALVAHSSVEVAQARTPIHGGQHSPAAPVTSGPSNNVPAPVNTGAPSVSGTAAVGDALSVSNGTWSYSPTGYSYQWEDCNSSGGSCSAISGATSSSYTVAASDENHTIMAVVTAANSSGSASVSSSATSTVAVPVVAPANTAVPVISGTAAVGDAVSVSKGSWSGSPTGYS